MNRLDLDVPKTVSNMTREEYNDLVAWMHDSATRQIDLMLLMLSPQTEARALEIRKEIADITKLVARTIQERVGSDVPALIAITCDVAKYKAAYPSKMTLSQAKVLSSSGMMTAMLRGEGL